VYVQRVDIRREPRETEVHTICYREDLREIYIHLCIHDTSLPTIRSVAHLYIHSSDARTHAKPTHLLEITHYTHGLVAKLEVARDREALLAHHRDDGTAVVVHY
jgi:hypothetical protein